jgi:signal peptidase I
MILVLILFLIVYLPTLSTYSALVAAGADKNKALLPFINTFELVKLIGRPKYQAFVIYLPIFNFFLMFSFLTDFSRCFGK